MGILYFIIPFLLVSCFLENEKFKKPLTKDEEEKLVREYRKNKSSKVRDELIERNLRLVANIARKYVNQKNEFDDLMSIGIIGLIKGVNTYKFERGNKLSTYIARCIENEILMHFRKIKRSNDDLYIEDTIKIDKEGNSFGICDILKSNDKELNEQTEDSLNLKKIEDNFEEVLNDKEKYIIKKRYGVYGENKETQTMIAKKLGISRSYVSRIEKGALLKLRKILDKKEKYEK